jgi:uncharacterized Fe-S cluster-containing radical SAM superfamily protein
MSNEKTYIPSSIKKVTTKYGDLFNASLKLEDLQKIVKRGWVSITIAERKEVSEKGATHYAFENTYEPPKKVDETASETAKEDDLPF